MIKLNKKELINWIDDADKVDVYPTKHDCHCSVYVKKVGDKFYRVKAEFSYNDGLQMWDDYVELEEVVPYEVTVTKYKKV